MTMIRAALLVVVLGAGFATGCGDDQTSAPAEQRSSKAAMTEQAAKDKAMKDGAMKGEGRAGAAPRAASGTTVRLVASQFGRILGDRRGQAFYRFDKETSKRSECYGACASAWPPVLANGNPRAGRGAAARLLGTTRRRDGEMQVTYRGRPLYYYRDDGPGRVLCHNVDEFGGRWQVVRSSGAVVS
jgi:predicted lipoprotein with Yx(FWY)xxD motif